jgi:putative drug exporter of the RND superfamily
MTRALHAVGRACARHHVIVIAVWLVVVVALAAVSSSIGQQTSDNLVLPGTDSQRASDILTARFPQQANGTNPVAMRAPSGKKLSDQQQKDAIDNVVDAYKKDPGVEKVVTPSPATAPAS